jgi:hypothetical protein
MQALERFFPKSAIDEIVPFGNQVINRTTGSHAADQLAGMAKWDTAIHTARALVAQLVLREMLVKLVPVFHPL